MTERRLRLEKRGTGSLHGLDWHLRVPREAPKTVATYNSLTDVVAVAANDVDTVRLHALPYLVLHIDEGVGFIDNLVPQYLLDDVFQSDDAHHFIERISLTA